MSDGARACDLDGILAGDDIEVVESEVREPGYTACLVRPVPDLPAGIMLAPDQSRGRRRFSVAHELGHYHIPTHQGIATGWCGDADMTAGAHGGNVREQEANDFAAELLMPRHLFSQDARGRDPNFREIGELAQRDMYDVSRTAAALRYVEVTQSACSLVCARDGIIEWVAKSKDFVYRIPWRGDPVPAESHARAVFNGEEASEEAEPLDPYAWLEIEQRQPVELFESTLAIPRQSQVLSLVWVVSEGDWV
ncbi:MAG: ImmA/IrrE family metallo-endopeptidase [Gemmatimonadetes bacterium]|nr:ImmA/IrrE family metallo-endopeptidase [Gemmatimonadota bacterium]